MSMIRTVVGKLEKLQLPRERTAFAPLPRVRPSLACARHAPARPVFRIIAFTSSPNAHNLLICSVLR